MQCLQQFFGLHHSNLKLSSHDKLTPNIFGYKIEIHHTLSPSPFTFNDDGLPSSCRGTNHSPVKRPRKISISLFKVSFFFSSNIERLGFDLDFMDIIIIITMLCYLQNNFYLNYVDWSSHIVLAVALGNCLFEECTDAECFSLFTLLGYNTTSFLQISLLETLITCKGSDFTVRNIVLFV